MKLDFFDFRPRDWLVDEGDLEGLGRNCAIVDIERECTLPVEVHCNVLVGMRDYVKAVVLHLNWCFVPPVAVKSINVSGLVEKQQRLVFPERSRLKWLVDLFFVSASMVDHLLDSIWVREFPVEGVEFNLQSSIIVPIYLDS